MTYKSYYDIILYKSYNMIYDIIYNIYMIKHKSYYDKCCDFLFILLYFFQIFPKFVQSSCLNFPLCSRFHLF